MELERRVGPKDESLCIVFGCVVDMGAHLEKKRRNAVASPKSD